MPATQITRTMLAQIGSGNILATSGGRVYVSEDGDTVTMPVAQGYGVEVTYEPGLDLYTVRRTMTRKGVRRVKAQLERVYCEDLGEHVYRAGCWRDPWGEVPVPACTCPGDCACRTGRTPVPCGCRNHRATV